MSLAYRHPELVTVPPAARHQVWWGCLRKRRFATMEAAEGATDGLDMVPYRCVFGDEAAHWHLTRRRPL